MKYYVKAHFLEGVEEKYIYDESGKKLFKIWVDQRLKVGVAAVVMTLDNEELYTIAEKLQTCLVYREDELVAECLGGPSQPHLQVLRRSFCVKKDEMMYRLKGNWFGFDFTNHPSAFNIGSLEGIEVTCDDLQVGRIKFTEDESYELDLADDEDAAFWVTILLWVDYQLSIRNWRR